MLLKNAKSNRKREDTLAQSTKKQESDRFPERTKWILLMLFIGGTVRKYNEPISGKIRLLKEIFILKEQAKIKENMYDFIPYKYGPYSADLLSDLKLLEKNKIINAKEGFGGVIFELTPEGIKLASDLYLQLNEELKRRLFGIKTRFNYMPLNQLLDYVYSTYPTYATYSEKFKENKLEEA